MIFGVSFLVLGLLCASFVCGMLFGKSLLGGLESRLMSAIHSVPAATVEHAALASHPAPPPASAKK